MSRHERAEELKGLMKASLEYCRLQQVVLRESEDGLLFGGYEKRKLK